MTLPATAPADERPDHTDCEARLIVENMPGFAWSADQDGKLRYVNARFLEYTGKRIEELNGVEGVARFARTGVLHPGDVEHTGAAWSHAVATGDPYVVEHRVRRGDGTYRWFRSSAVRIRDPRSREIGWYGVDIDIDDQKRTDEALRHSEQSLNRLIETLPAMIWRATPDGEPDYINPRLASYTGRGLDGVGRGAEDLGRTLDDLVQLRARNAMVHQDDLDTAAAAWARAHETGAFELTARLRGADGAYRWFQARAEPMRDEAGGIVHWYGVAVDIDDRKRAEDALRTSEQELRGIVDALPQAISVLRPDGTGLYVNQTLLDYTGLTMDQLMTPDAQGYPVLFHREDWDRLRDERQRALARSLPFEFEWRVRRKDGQFRWFLVRYHPLRDEQGRILRWYASGTDIDDRKRAEEALRKSEQELRLLIETLPAMVWRTTADGKPDYINQRYADYLGRPLAGLAEAQWRGVVHPDDVATATQHWSVARETETPLDATLRFRKADGAYHWFHVHAEPLRDGDGRVVRWYGVNVDIDDRKRAEDALRKSEQELRDIVDALPQPIVVLRPDGTGLYVNRPLIEYTGLTREELMSPDTRGNPVLYPPEDWPRLREQRQRGLERLLPFEIEARVRRKDGQFRWFLVRYHPLRDEQGQILRWYVSGTDIDDRKRAEEALQKSEQELRLLIETLPAMVWRTTADGKPDYINQRFADYLGRPTPADLAALAQGQWHAIIHPDDVATAARECRQTDAPIDTICRFRRADGAYRWFHAHAEPLRDGDGRVVRWYGVHVDIDDLKKAEEALRATQAQLSRASEIAAVSGIAASIAHEISQPLAAMVAYGHACQRWLAADPPNLERAQLAAERIVRDGTSAADVVSRIRALFKRADLTRTLVNLNHVIGEVTRLLTDELAGGNVSLATDLADDLPPIWADPVQIQQVIANLARNGVDAMASAEGQPTVLHISSRREGTNRVLIEVRDQGSGLDDLERVFEPFFTTKQEGMGMGLAICRWIVEAHEGRLWAAHNSPRGAVFSFTLPISSKRSP